MKKQKSPLIFHIIAGIALLIIFTLGYLYLVPTKKTVSQTKSTPEETVLLQYKNTSALPFSNPQPAAFEYRFDSANDPVVINGYKIVATGTGKEFKPLGQDVLTIQNEFVKQGFTVGINNQADGPGSSQTGVQKDSLVCIVHTATPNIFKTPGCPNEANYNDPGTCEALVEISCGIAPEQAVTE